MRWWERAQVCGRLVPQAAHSRYFDAAREDPAPARDMHGTERVAEKLPKESRPWALVAKAGLHTPCVTVVGVQHT